MLKKILPLFLKKFYFYGYNFFIENFLMKIEEIYINIHLFTLLCFMGYFWQYDMHVIKAYEDDFFVSLSSIMLSALR